jgi:hypothetical protein
MPPPPPPPPPSRSIPPPPPLPPGWIPDYSHQHNRWYFINPLTNRSTWDLPSVTGAEEEQFIRPIRNRNRSIRTDLRFNDDAETAQREREWYREDEVHRQTARNMISPSQFDEADPRRYVSGNFFVNIGIHFPKDGQIVPSSKSFAYFKRAIKEQGIFCEKMSDAEVLDIAKDLFIYNPYMNIDPVRNRVPDREKLDILESIRHMQSANMRQHPVFVNEIIKYMNVPKNVLSSVVVWKMLTYAKIIQGRCEGTCAIRREDPSQQSKAGSMIVSAKQKRITKTTCGFTAPSIAVATLFLQVMGSDFLDAFRKHSKCSIKAKSRSRSKTPVGLVRGVNVKTTIYGDVMLSQYLAIFDRTLSVDEPRLYAKLNTVINQLYDNNRKYKTGIRYMNSKRPDLFRYSGLKLGINIISVVQSGVTVHHSFIFNMGDVSVIMDSWAHGNHSGYIFGRELVTRIWVTDELDILLNNLHPERSRSFQSMKNTLIRVFLAPHADNMHHYPQFARSAAISERERRLYLDELDANDKKYDHTDFTIISINQNFLMAVFSFNFGFTNDILFGGGGIGRSLLRSLKSKSSSSSSLKNRRRRRHATTHKKMIK